MVKSDLLDMFHVHEFHHKSLTPIRSYLISNETQDTHLRLEISLESVSKFLHESFCKII